MQPAEASLSESEPTQKLSQMIEEIVTFVEASKGLKVVDSNEGAASISQTLDGKIFTFQFSDLSEVLQRSDAEGKGFIQVNFQNGNKVLFTESLVGFKPKETPGLDMSKIPKVVTTPDLVSVFEAIEESMSSDTTPDYEVEILRKVFQAILQGGELAGFDLSFEKKWLFRLVPHQFKASA